MGKAVQHFFSMAQPPDRCPVIFLIQKKTCLLPVLHIHNIFYAVFGDFYFCVKRFPYKPFPSLHPLVFPHLGIASFIDPPDFDTVCGKHLL